jgi:hypothetical protein
MTIPISLRAVVDEMEMLNDGLRAFLNQQTAEIYSGTDELIAKAESDDDGNLLGWEIEAVERLREILGSADWIQFPLHDAQDNYRIMERFCLERTEGSLQEKLLSAINGRGAFGRFRDAVRRHGIQESWRVFNSAQVAKRAKAWLESHKIAFTP